MKSKIYDSSENLMQIYLLNINQILIYSNHDTYAVTAVTRRHGQAEANFFLMLVMVGHFSNKYIWPIHRLHYTSLFKTYVILLNFVYII